MPETNAPVSVWMTLALHAPSPNCKFAAFVRNVDGALVATVVPVDFVALQEVTIAGEDPDGDDDVTATRVVPIVLDWSGLARECTLDGGDPSFAACAPTVDEAEAKAREVVARLGATAPPPAAP